MAIADLIATAEAYDELLELMDDLSAAFQNVMSANPPMPEADRASRLALIKRARLWCDAALRPDDEDEDEDSNS